MKQQYSLLMLLLCIPFLGFAQSTISQEKQEILQSLDAKQLEFGALAHEIWGLAELGYQEEQSSQLLMDKL